MIDGGLLVAYHGCDVTVRDDLVSGRLPRLRDSSNDYDWLGSGSYFYEADHVRALQFAQASHDEPQHVFTKEPIATPAVVGAVLAVSRWLDMTTQAGLAHFQSGFATLKSGLEAAGQPLPVNAPARPGDTDVILHKLDQAVFETIHRTRKIQALPAFQAVRGAFYQGPEAAPSSAFRSGSHVQLALCDAMCVVGWFLIPGSRLLSDDALATARAALGAAKAARTAVKPRRRG